MECELMDYYQSSKVVIRSGRYCEIAEAIVN